jgi:hypothetical protein
LGHESSTDSQGDIVAKLLQQMTVSTPVANTRSSDEEVQEASKKYSNLGEEDLNQNIYATPLPPSPQPIPQSRPHPSQIPPNAPSAASSHAPAPPQFDHGT